MVIVLADYAEEFGDLLTNEIEAQPRQGKDTEVSRRP